MSNLHPSDLAENFVERQTIVLVAAIARCRVMREAVHRCIRSTATSPAGKIALRVLTKE